MKQAKQKFKRILPSQTPKKPDRGSQPLPTAPLRFAGGFLDALPIPGAGAAARPILALAEGINASALAQHSKSYVPLTSSSPPIRIAGSMQRSSPISTDIFNLSPVFLNPSARWIHPRSPQTWAPMSKHLSSMHPNNILEYRADCVHSELSTLATKWKKGKDRSVFDLLPDKGKGGDEVSALAGGIKRALDEFQVCVCHCMLTCIQVDRGVPRLREP